MKGGQRRRNESEQCQEEKVEEDMTRLRMRGWAQPGVSMAWVKVMEGFANEEEEGEGGRKEGAGQGKRGEGGEACTNEPQKRVCVHTTLV